MTLDRIGDVLLPAARHEVCQLINQLRAEDLTAFELIVMLTALRAAAERKRTPAKLSLIHGGDE